MNKWISIEDKKRKPEPWQYVLGYSENAVPNAVCVPHVVIYSGSWRSKTTHWMPLPEAPEK